MSPPKYRSDIIIAGGGHAGAQAAIALRQHGHEGSITIVTEEDEFPYERPPLSKEYLSKEKTFERILIRPPKFWNEKDISFAFGHRIENVNSLEHLITDASGNDWKYDKLIWACGGHARRLSCPGSDLGGIHSVRTRRDVDDLERELEKVKQVVVIGGGFIGLEAAAVLAKAGKTVTVVEAQDRVLARVAAEPLSRFYETEHRAHGVNILLERQVAELEGLNGRVGGVRLADGLFLAAEIVIVGIGIEPAVAPLLAAGAGGSNGVDVDEYCRTNLPDIYAVGDCACHVNVFSDGRRMRIESVQNAADQAITAARDIVGKGLPYGAIPWFWSNQYDLKLQTVGLNVGYDGIIVRGDLQKRSFSVIYLREGVVVALDCVNAMADYIHGKALINNHVRAEGRDLTDISIPLKSLITPDG